MKHVHSSAWSSPTIWFPSVSFSFLLNGNKFLVVSLLIFVQAMNEMNGKEIEGEEIEIVLAKPPDKKRKERQAARQASRSTA